MIDTCPANVAGWSEDGETFVVKDPTCFEQSIIPQFFKHSKFSSFVRVRTMDGKE
jgi:HSF-type DNA-binding